jgi:hypothetical protein
VLNFQWSTSLCLWTKAVNKLFVDWRFESSDEIEERYCSPEEYPPKTINQSMGWKMCQLYNDQRENAKRWLKWYKENVKIEWNEIEWMNGENMPRRDTTIFFLFVLNLWSSISLQVVLVNWELLYVGGKQRCYWDTCCGLNVNWRFKSSHGIKERHCTLNAFVS